jgi:hypothetical protein
MPTTTEIKSLDTELIGRMFKSATEPEDIQVIKLKVRITADAVGTPTIIPPPGAGPSVNSPMPMGATSVYKSEFRTDSILKFKMEGDPTPSPFTPDLPMKPTTIPA